MLLFWFEKANKHHIEFLPTYAKKLGSNPSFLHFNPYLTCSSKRLNITETTPVHKKKLTHS